MSRAGASPGHIEEDFGGPADDLPAAGALARVDAGLGASQSNRASRHARARNGQARHLNRWVNGAEIRKAREKPEHEDAIGHGTVASHHLVRLELHRLGNSGEIGPIGSAVRHHDFDDRARRCAWPRCGSVRCSAIRRWISPASAHSGDKCTATEVRAGHDIAHAGPPLVGNPRRRGEHTRRRVGVHARLERNEPRVVAEPAQPRTRHVGPRSVGGRPRLGRQRAPRGSATCGRSSGPGRRAAPRHALPLRAGSAWRPRRGLRALPGSESPLRPARAGRRRPWMISSGALTRSRYVVGDSFFSASASFSGSPYSLARSARAIGGRYSEGTSQGSRCRRWTRRRRRCPQTSSCP